jgi:2-keto-4-pentenoate hydratase/2-oxohepta-3-ene-1,7-dioic acid hydratase in catechol pathway
MERIYQRYFSLHENKKILCVARNYAAYLQPGEAKPTSPSFFDKPYSSLITDGQRYFLRYLTFTGREQVSQAKTVNGTWDLAEFYLETPDLRSNS